MSARGWRWLVALTIVATTLIAIAGGIDFISNVIRPEKRTECQDSPACRTFIQREISKAIERLEKKLEQAQKEVVGGGGKNNPSGQPGPPKGGPRDHQQGGAGSTPGGTQDALRDALCGALDQVGGAAPDVPQDLPNAPVGQLQPC